MGGTASGKYVILIVTIVRFSASSLTSNVIVLAPSFNLKTQLHVVQLSLVQRFGSGILFEFRYIIIEAFSSIVPASLCNDLFVGVVTGSTVNAGGTVSRIMVFVTVVVFPAVSLPLTIIVLAPSAKLLTTQLQVVLVG